jgi:serine protease Do
MKRTPREVILMRIQQIQVSRMEAIIFLVLALATGAALPTLLIAKSNGAARGAMRPVTIDVAHDTSPAAPHVSFVSGFAPVVKKALPAVVNISSTKIVRVRGRGAYGPFFQDPFWRQFFGGQFGPEFQVPRKQREHSLGSGVIVSPEGYILTNNHVVSGATNIEVSTSDGRQYQARVIGTDSKSDIAVLRIDAAHLPALPLGDSSKMQVGDFVLAIGDPFGIGKTVTMGIVSATGRGNLGIEHYEDFIQTDAAINPGNSGGALINVRGELIGINTAIVSSSGGNNGVGFAIPINLARNVMDQILKHGRVIRGYLGVRIQNVTPDLAKAFGLSEARGALVGDVSPGGPAAQAGIERGDIILAMNGQPIQGVDDLSLRVSQTPPGTPVRLGILREGKQREVAVKLAELPQAATASKASQQSSAALAGMQVQDLTPQIAQQLGLSPSTRGVVIVSVEQGSAAAYAVLERGEVIREVNHHPVNSVEEYQQVTAHLGKQPALLLVDRGGATFFTVVEPQ